MQARGESQHGEGNPSKDGVLTGGHGVVSSFCHESNTVCWNKKQDGCVSLVTFMENLKTLHLILAKRPRSDENLKTLEENSVLMW